MMPQKRLTSGTRADRARSGEYVFWALPGKPQVERVGAKVDVPWPLNLAMGAEFNPREHPLLLPHGKDTLACQVRQVYLSLRPILVAQPNAVGREGSNLNRAHHIFYLPLTAEATLALLVGADRAEEVHSPERRPVRVAEVELAVGALPQEEAREADLAAGADDEVRVGKIGRVEILADRLLRDALDDRLHVFALLVLLAQHRLHRVDDLLASAIGERDRQVHRAIGRGRFLGRPDRGDRGVGQEVELADGPHAQPQALRARVVGEPPQLGLDGRQDAGDLSGRPPEVVGREHPQADGGDADLRAPLQDLVELLGPERVRLAKIRNA